jgi:hypothetical protein
MAFLPVLAVVALLGVPACSLPRLGQNAQPTTSPKPASPKEAVLAALNKSASADTLTAHQVMQPTPDAPTPLNAWATAVVSRPQGAVYFSGDYSAIFKTLFIGIEPGGANEEIVVMRNATFWRVVGPAADRLRVQFPTMSDRSWIRTPRDPGDVAEFIANVVSFTQDPGEFLGFGAKAVDSVADLGSDRVNGTPMHHYAVKLDDQKWSAAITARYPESQEGSEYSVVAAMPTDFNVWVTDSGHVGRTSGVLERELITDDFSSYGQPVSIPIPKAEDIVNAPP